MGKALGISALILGLIGAGLGGYVFVTTTIFPMVGITDMPSVQNTWFINKTTSSTLGDNTYAYFSPISHIISVNQGESVYILFTGYLRLTAGATDASFAIYIDGILKTYSLITRTSTGTERIIISIQYGGSWISPGTHNISVWGYSNLANQLIYRSALLVQTYN